MKHSYCKFYSISCLLLFFSNYLWAEKLDLPTVTSCTLNVSQDQQTQTLLLDRCKVAAKAGDKDAQYQLGLYYSEGKLIEPNYPEALYWLQQASSQADVDAQLRLAEMYYHGKGVAVNNLQAYIIFKVASINGSDVAMDEADNVAEHMTQQELEQANYVLGKIFREYLKTINR